MKNYYLAITISKDEKNYAYCLKVEENQNLIYSLNIPNIIIADICPTKKNAEEVVELWNECFKKNGTYSIEVVM